MEATRDSIEKALYTDKEGTIIGLPEVQLMEDPPVERFTILREATQLADVDLVYKAAMVLAAWGDDVGLATIEHLIDERIHEKYLLVPHRIYGYDNIYDELAEAVHLFGSLGAGSTEHRREQAIRVYRKLLELYGPCNYESTLKSALKRSDLSELAADVEAAIKRALSLRKCYLASQLLPCLARWKPAATMDLIPVFLQQEPEAPNPIINVAEALRHISSERSKQLLTFLRQHADPLVRTEAEEAIKRQEDVNRAASLADNECPTRYCRWWVSWSFEWQLSPKAGCELTSRQKPPRMRFADVACCRSDSTSPVDHFEPREPCLQEDGVDPSRWLRSRDSKWDELEKGKEGS